MNASAEHLFAISARLAAEPTAAKLHTRHLVALRSICDHPRPISIHALAAMIDISASTASRTADRLVTEGLLTRADDPADRRIALLTPTSAGRALNRRIKRYLLATEPAEEEAA